MAEEVQAVIGGWELAKVALTSGVVAALAGGGLVWFKEYCFRASAAKQDAEIAAIMIIASLDALAVKCFHDIQDYERVSGELEGTLHEGKHQLCDIPSFNLDGGELSKVDRTIASEIIWLNNEIFLASDLIRSKWHYDILDSREASEQHINLAGAYGYRAIQLSSRLREKYGLRGINSVGRMPDVESSLMSYFEDSKKFQASVT